MRSYEAARSLFSFLAFIAWSVIVIGVLVALASATGASRYGGGAAGLIAMVPGIGIGITGFILVAFVQMGRATVDTAEYTQQMLKLSRDQLEVSKQSLKLQNTAPQTLTAVTQKESAQGSKNSFANQLSTTSPTEGEPKGSKMVQPPAEGIVYQGRTIAVVDGSFHFAKMSFATLEKAQSYIDRLGVNPAAQLSGETRNS